MMPKTPGSTGEAEVLTGAGNSSCAGEEERTTAAMRIERSIQ